MALTSSSDDGFREIQLNGKQLVFLFMAVTVVSVVIFLCGVLVGRGVRGETTMAATEEAVADMASGEALPPPPAAAPSGSNEPAPKAAEATPAPTRADASAAKPEEKAPATPTPATTPAGTTGEPAGPGFAIQVAALRERTEAEAIAKRLVGKGYNAYVLAPVGSTPSVYRVRVGKFPTRREAESMAAKLQKEEQFKPWVTK